MNYIQNNIFDSIYFGFDESQMDIFYPGGYQGIFQNWTQTSLYWSNFANKTMLYYDIRWRDFYIEAIKFK